jgi:hypothetical protein
MIRARIIATREAGREEKHDTLLAQGRVEGLDLAGYRLGPAMIADLERAQAPHDDITLIGHEMLSAPCGCARSPAKTTSRPTLWPPSSP